MVKKKQSKSLKCKILGCLLNKYPNIIKYTILILLSATYSLELFSQKRSSDSTSWEFGTQVILRNTSINISGVYVSKKINEKFDIFFKTESLGGFLGAQKKDPNQTSLYGYYELTLSKYDVYLSLKVNKNFQNNTQLYATLGPYIREYSYNFRRQLGSGNVATGSYEDLEFQIRSLLGASIVIKELFKISIETPFSWFTQFRGSQNNDQLGPRIGDVRAVSIRLGILF